MAKRIQFTHLSSKHFAWFVFVALGATLASNIACSRAKWHEPDSRANEPAAPLTGDPISERRVVPATPTLHPGDTGYISTDRVYIRGNCNQSAEQEVTPRVLEENQQVVIIDPSPEECNDSGFRKVRIKDRKNPGNATVPVYVPSQYVDDKPVPPSTEVNSADRYFVVQNIATGKLRIYERCFGEDCAHRLILETDLVVGQNTSDGSRRTLLGSYKITKWMKFYEDTESMYPSFFNPNYPALPGAGAPLDIWASRELLPNGRGTTRGSFGWYTAFIGPQAEEQWTHGTWGWGSDRSRFIDAVRKSPAAENPDLASHGCTRVENQAIAFMREILPEGTRVFRIYAKEDLLDRKVKKSEPKSWRWVLSTEGVDEEGPSADFVATRARKIKKEQVLDKGVFSLNQTPSLAKGNVYGLPEQSFEGRFLVDQGRVAGYTHPTSLAVGGHKDRGLPSFFKGDERSLMNHKQNGKKQDRLLGDNQDRRLRDSAGTIVNQ